MHKEVLMEEDFTSFTYYSSQAYLDGSNKYNPLRRNVIDKITEWSKR